MITSIFITSNILALVILFAVSKFLIPRLKKEWMKSFLKWWIDFAFVAWAVSVCMITIPMQVYDTLLLGMFVFFALFFYILQPISPGSFILMPKDVTDPVRLAKINAKKKGFYKALVAYIVLIFISMIVGMGYLLDKGDFSSTANEDFLINDDGNILMDMYDDNTFGVGFFDETKDGIYDTIRYDLNGDGMTDVAYSDWLGNGSLVEMVYDGKEQRNWLFVFWVFLFFAFFMYEVFKGDKKGTQAVASLILFVFIFNIFVNPSVFGDYELEEGESFRAGLMPGESRYSDYDDDDYYENTEYDNANEADSARCRSDYQGDRVLCSDPYGYNENPYSSSSGQPERDSDRDTDDTGSSSEYHYPSHDYDINTGRETDSSSSSSSSSSTTKTTPKTTPQPRQKTQAEIDAEKKAMEEKRKKEREEFKKKMDEEIRQKEIKENTVNFIESAEKDKKSIYEVLGTDRNKLSKKDQEKYDAFDQQIGRYKTNLSFTKGMVEEIGGLYLNREFQNILNQHGKKSIELGDRLTVFKSRVNNMMKKNNASKFGSSIKAHKKAIGGLENFQKKNMGTWQSKMDSYVGKKNAVKSFGKVVGGATDVLGAYNDYNEFNKEFKDPNKALTATATQTFIGKTLGANPVDMATGLASAGLGILGFDNASKTVGQLSVGHVSKSGIKDAFTTGYGEFKDIVGIQYDNFKNSKGVVDGATTAFVGTATTVYTAGVAVSKPVLEVGSKVVGGAVSMASAGVKTVSNGVKSVVSGIKSWF